MQINITDKQRKRAGKYIYLTGNNDIDDITIAQLEMLRQKVASGIANDKVKPFIPEAYKTSLVMTINARSLQNFLELRSSNHALWEIQELAKAIYNSIPEEHKFLYEYIYEKENN